MDGLQVSHCPLCRHPYNHFPNVCQMLHLILLKMYPIACNKRDHQIMGELLIVFDLVIHVKERSSYTGALRPFDVSQTLL